MSSRHQGLIAATLTPLKPDGTVKRDSIGPMLEQLIDDEISGVYVCGSTGEGVSLAAHERRQVAEETVRSAAGRIPVWVQVGHNALPEAYELARHAAEIGADAISATCPSYFQVDSIESLTACMAEIAQAAPQLPFYYYHIPSLTGNRLSMPSFLEFASERIPNLAGLKFTTPELHVYQQCRLLQKQRFEIFWGTDEMLLPALASGAEAAIGSTYNVAAPLYHRLQQAFQQGDLAKARELQARAVELVDILVEFPFQAALKKIMQWRGLELGACRLPLSSLTSDQERELEFRLQQRGFDEWPVST